MDGSDGRGAVRTHMAGPIAVALVMGILVSLVAPAHPRAARGAVAAAPTEIGAPAYEALRAAIPRDPSLARPVLAALADGRIDEAEYARLAPDPDATAPTPLDIAAARRDLVATAHAFSVAPNGN